MQIFTDELMVESWFCCHKKHANNGSVRKFIGVGGDLKLSSLVSQPQQFTIFLVASQLLISFSSEKFEPSDTSWDRSDLARFCIVCWTRGHVVQSNGQNWVLVDLNFNSKLNCPSFPPTRKSTRYSPHSNQVDNNRSCILHWAEENKNELSGQSVQVSKDLYQLRIQYRPVNKVL